MKGPVGLQVFVGATLIMSLMGLSFATPPHQPTPCSSRGASSMSNVVWTVMGPRAEAMEPELSLCPLDQVISSLPIHRPSPIRSC